MLQLRLLGTPAIDAGAESLGGAANQRKPLALLALLAVSGERGLSRDKLLAYLWPESDADRARHALRQLLHVLRRDLRTEALFVGGSRMRLDFRHIDADVTQFDAARRSGQLERAVALYGGPFLDGFFLKGAPEFERWVETERAAFDRAYTEMLGVLAADAASRGDARAAAGWWCRLAEHEPTSPVLTLRAMTALVAAGDPAGALQQAQIYQALVRQELEAMPSWAVLALESKLRHAVSDLRTPAVSIAVLPFTHLCAAPKGDYFAEGLAEELSRALARLEGVRVVAQASVLACDLARLGARELGLRLGAQLLLQGSIRQSGDRIRLTAQLVDATAAFTVWSDRYERRMGEIFALQDHFTQSVVEGVQRALRAFPRLQPIPLDAVGAPPPIAAP